MTYMEVYSMLKKAAEQLPLQKKPLTKGGLNGAYAGRLKQGKKDLKPLPAYKHSSNNSSVKFTKDQRDAIKRDAAYNVAVQNNMNAIQAR